MNKENSAFYVSFSQNIFTVLLFHVKVMFLFFIRTFFPTIHILQFRFFRILAEGIPLEKLRVTLLF